LVLQERLKDIAKQNAKKIAATIVELALYNTAFHHAKQGLKYATKRQKWVPHNPDCTCTVNYVLHS